MWEQEMQAVKCGWTAVMIKTQTSLRRLWGLRHLPPDAEVCCTNETIHMHTDFFFICLSGYMNQILKWFPLFFWPLNSQSPSLIVLITGFPMEKLSINCLPMRFSWKWSSQLNATFSQSSKWLEISIFNLVSTLLFRKTSSFNLFWGCFFWTV